MAYYPASTCLGLANNKRACAVRGARCGVCPKVRLSTGGYLEAGLSVLHFSALGFQNPVDGDQDSVPVGIAAALLNKMVALNLCGRVTGLRHMPRVGTHTQGWDA